MIGIGLGAGLSVIYPRHPLMAQAHWNLARYYWVDRCPALSEMTLNLRRGGSVVSGVDRPASRPGALPCSSASGVRSRTPALAWEALDARSV